MKPDFKIAISGAHSQGKTTLVDKLSTNKDLCSYMNFSFRTNLTRGIKGLNLPINESGNDITQLMIMGRHLEYAYTPGRWILDRCALDGIAYTTYLTSIGQVSPPVSDAAHTFVYKCLTQYDKIFYIEPELPLKIDGTRSTQLEFFNGVVDKFNYYIDFFGLQDKIIRLSGSVKQREDKVIEEILKS